MTASDCLLRPRRLASAVGLCLAFGLGSVGDARAWELRGCRLLPSPSGSQASEVRRGLPRFSPYPETTLAVLESLFGGPRARIPLATRGWPSPARATRLARPAARGSRPTPYAVLAREVDEEIRVIRELRVAAAPTRRPPGTPGGGSPKLRERYLPTMQGPHWRSDEPNRTTRPEE